MSKSEGTPVTPNLKRRGIHEEPKDLDENMDSEDDSPQKHSKLYPDIPDDNLLSKELQQIIESKRSKNIQPKTTKQQIIERRKPKSIQPKTTQQQIIKCSKPKNIQHMATNQIPFFKRFPVPSYAIYIVIIIIVLVGLFSGIFKESPSEMTLEEIVTRMQSVFKNQRPTTYRILKKALQKVVDHPNPSAPAIFTIAANKNARTTASEFSLYLAESFASQNYILINNSMFWQNNPKEIMLRIDQEIKSNINKSKNNVIVVDNLQNIPYEAAMIFHSYCDHLLAPFKQAIFLFNVLLDTDLSENVSHKTIDETAMKQIRNFWRQASDDVIDSLITRITVNVINIR